MASRFRGLGRPGIFHEVARPFSDALAAVFRLICLYGDIDGANEFIKAAKTHPNVLQTMLLTGNRDELAEGFRLACLRGHIEIVKACLHAAQSQAPLLRGLVNSCLLYAQQQPTILMWLLRVGIPNEQVTVDLKTAYEHNNVRKIRECVERALCESQNICSKLLEAKFADNTIGFFINSSAVAKREEEPHQELSIYFYPTL